MGKLAVDGVFLDWINDGTIKYVPTPLLEAAVRHAWPVLWDLARRWIDASPTTRHGEHRYDIRDYGISADAIRHRFADYMSRHQLD